MHCFYKTKYRYLNTSGVGVIIDLTNVVLSFSMTLLYCIDPQTTDDKSIIVVLKAQKF